MPPQREQQTPPGNRRRRPDTMPGGWFWMVVLMMVILLLVFMANGFMGASKVDYSDFMTLVDNGKFSRVIVTPTTISGELRVAPDKLGEKWQKIIRGKEVVADLPTKSDAHIAKLTEKLDEAKKDDKLKSWDNEPDQGAWISTFIVMMIPIMIIAAIFFLFILPRVRDPLGGGFLSNYIKSPAKRYEKTKARVTFNDVADMTAAKSELQEMVEFLRNPEKFQRLGAQVPKGVLLIGPPGTGKTLLARAVAGEAGVPFYSISGSEFIQMFVGVGASRVRDLFKTAKENSPCLIFIDEIDAVGRMRGAGVGGGSDEREQTLNQILSEMDGFHPNESVIVIAATNRPDVLDSALLRPGRFDRHVTIDRPTWQGRLEILKVHTRNKPLADDVDLEILARKMIGMTGADLRNLANEAALLATREDKTRIDRRDFERAADRVLLGPTREELLTPEGKRRTAYHEAGHALVGWLEPECDPPMKISIIPRGRALGVTFSMPEEERLHHGLDYFKARLILLMGGRAADRLVYNQAFSGHEDDLKQATRLARFMVTHWGMSDRLGPMAFRIGEEHVFLGKEIQEQRDFSEHTAAIIDEEVQKLLREADQQAQKLLEEHREQLDHLVEELLKKEELYRDEIEKILGPMRSSNNGNQTDGIYAADRQEA